MVELGLVSGKISGYEEENQLAKINSEGLYWVYDNRNRILEKLYLETSER